MFVNGMISNVLIFWGFLLRKVGNFNDRKINVVKNVLKKEFVI